MYSQWYSRKHYINAYDRDYMTDPNISYHILNKTKLNDIIWIQIQGKGQLKLLSNESVVSQNLIGELQTQPTSTNQLLSRNPKLIYFN
jgi:hypothetical protein